MPTPPSKRDSNWTTRELETAYDTLWDRHEEHNRRVEAILHGDSSEKIQVKLDSTYVTKILQY